MKHQLKCQTVTVRFNRPHMQGQVINVSNGPTATQYIEVEQDAVRLAIHFKNAHDMTLRTIAFNNNDVTEHDCEGVIDNGRKL